MKPHLLEFEKPIVELEKQLEELKKHSKLQAIDLSGGEAATVKSPTDVGTGKATDEKAPLSEVITVLNDRFGTDFTEEDRLFFEQIKEKASKGDARAALRLGRVDDRSQLGCCRAVMPVLSSFLAGAVDPNCDLIRGAPLCIQSPWPNEACCREGKPKRSTKSRFTFLLVRLKVCWRTLKEG